jgi:hypothetical protein
VLINEAVTAYQSSSRSYSECFTLIWRLIQSGCFDWDDWTCRVDDDYHGEDDD